MAPQRQHDLHGSAPDSSPAALLLIDFINDFEFDGARDMFPRALAAAQCTARLRACARRAGMPVIYCNDNFGKWRSDFRTLLDHCLEDPVRGRPIAELLRPDDEDYFVLKPKHSGFHSTTLEVLLAHLGARTLILTGVAGNFCVLFTAHDAYMRDFQLLVPRDCIASQSEDDDAYTLRHLERVCKADTRPSVEIDLASVAGSASRIAPLRG